MNKETIVVEIGGNGEIKAETFNIQGVTCSDELDKLMKDLAQIKTDCKKPEYFKSKTQAKDKVVVKR